MSERRLSRDGLQSRATMEEPRTALSRCPSSKQTRNRATKSIVERLQALHPGNELEKEKILQEVLPNQRSVLLAAPLFDSPRRTTAVLSGSTLEDRQLSPRRRRVRHQRSLAPLPTEQARPSGGERVADVETLTISATEPFDNHAVHIWEDKFVHHKLKVEDALYLLMHDDLIAVVESAVLMKATAMNSDQLLEVEMALEQLGGSEQMRSPVSSLARTSRSRMTRRTTICSRIFKSVWSNGSAFQMEANFGDGIRVASPRRAHAVLSPVKSQLNRGSATRLHLREDYEATKPSIVRKRKPVAVESIYSSCTNQDDFKRLSSDLKWSHDVLAVHTRDVLQSSRWIQENCIQEMMLRNSDLFHKMRKEKAAQMLVKLIYERADRAVENRFTLWRTHTLLKRCQHLVAQYCRLKGAAKVLILGRRLQKRSFLRRWHRWMRRLAIEHKMERLAGAVTIQSWARCILARQRRETFHIERAATTLQSLWRGSYKRKMLRRRRRYEAYTAAACVVQRSYRAYYNRCQFAIHWARQKASCCITRSLRQYCARRLMFKSWCHRVARFHSAAVIQVWLRATLKRIRDERHRRKMQTAAAFTVQRFFRYARFSICFGSRVKRLMQRKNAAAVKLQNAYRAKLARARFYALKDQLEAQRRQEILQMMWDNAYATTIQRSWRKKRLWRAQHQQRVHESHTSVAWEQLQTSSLDSE